jgi:hypothetical protein
LRAFARNYAAGLDTVTLAGLSVTALGSLHRPDAVRAERCPATLRLLRGAGLRALPGAVGGGGPAAAAESPLTPAQHAYLEAYGYPYVGDAFRFHMTLTGSLPSEQAGPVKRALEAAFAAVFPAAPVRIDRFALFRQDSRAGRFRLIDSYTFG